MEYSSLPEHTFYHTALLDKPENETLLYVLKLFTAL